MGGGSASDEGRIADFYVCAVGVIRACAGMKIKGPAGVRRERLGPHGRRYVGSTLPCAHPWHAARPSSRWRPFVRSCAARRGDDPAGAGLGASAVPRIRVLRMEAVRCVSDQISMRACGACPGRLCRGREYCVASEGSGTAKGKYVVVCASVQRTFTSGGPRGSKEFTSPFMIVTKLTR
jgi:hypothetical protein